MKLAVHHFVTETYPPIDTLIGEDEAFTHVLRRELLHLYLSSLDDMPAFLTAGLHRIRALLVLAYELAYFDEDVTFYCLDAVDSLLANCSS